MKPIRIFDKIYRRQIIFLTIGLILVAIVAVLVISNFLQRPKVTKAGVSVSGDDVTLSGDVFLVDNSGKIYQKPSKLLYDTGINGSFTEVLDYGYWTYLFDDTGYAVNSSTNLTIASDSTVYMEGTQALNNLNVRGTIKQPYSDRQGLINRPIHTSDYWGLRVSAFMRVPAGKTVYLSTDNVDDGIVIDASTDSSITDATSWTRVYSNRTSVYSDANWPRKNLNVAEYKTDSTSYNILSNSTGADRYVPIRISIGENAGQARMKVRYCLYDVAPAWTNQSCPGEIPYSNFYGVAVDGTRDSAKNSNFNYDYYVSQTDVPPSIDFSNAVKTAWRQNVTFPSGLSGAVGSINSTRFHLWWSEDHSAISVNKNDENYKTYRRYARHSQYIPVSSLYTPIRRIAAGLELNINSELRIFNSGRIDLTGTGYPGWAAEFKAITHPNTRGGSLNNDGTPGGGYSNVAGCNGAVGNGGSHAGKGGFFRPGNNCGTYLRPDSYGNQYAPNTMGSGAGAGNDDGRPNIPGSGGGLLKINTGTMTIDRGYAISVDGDAGEYIWWHTQAGGAGGAASITVNSLLQVNYTGGNPIITANGSNGIPNYPYGYSNYPRGFDHHVGGGGGYILVQAGGSNLSQLALKSLMSATGGEGGTYSTSTGVDNTSSGGADADGEDGFVEVSSLSNNISIKKSLTKLCDSDYPNCAPIPINSQSPYGLKTGDKIRVKLQIFNMTPNHPVVVRDEVFNDGVSKSFTIENNSWTNPSNYSPGSLTIGIENLNGFNNVTWRFNPTAANDTVEYNLVVN
jgi:hypothetical protein